MSRPGVRILVAEDDDDHRALIEAALRDSGRHHVVGWAETADEVIRETRRLRPDIVLLDLRLRRSSGTHSIPSLLQVTPRSMVVAMSAARGCQWREAALSAGAFAFIPKGPVLFSRRLPIAIDELLTHFDAALAGEERVAPVQVPRAG